MTEKKTPRSSNSRGRGEDVSYGDSLRMHNAQFFFFIGNRYR